VDVQMVMSYLHIFFVVAYFLLRQNSLKIKADYQSVLNTITPRCHFLCNKNVSIEVVEIDFYCKKYI